jgi:hypothetical protein
MVRVRIVTPCRIHITLIDLHGGLGQVDGGIGLALKSPKTILIVETAEKLTVSSFLYQRVEQPAKSVIKEFGIAGGAKISIEKAIPGTCRSRIRHPNCSSGGCNGQEQKRWINCLCRLPQGDATRIEPKAKGDYKKSSYDDKRGARILEEGTFRLR